MAIRVIDLFEVIDINHDDSKRDFLTHIARMLATNCIKRNPTVCDASQSVVRGPKLKKTLRSKKAILQVQNALAHMQARTQLLSVKGLRQVIVRAQFESVKDVLLLSPPRQ